VRKGDVAETGRPPDQTISLRRLRIETPPPPVPFPPSICRDLGLGLLITRFTLSRQSDEDAGSELSIQASSVARCRHGFLQLDGNTGGGELSEQ
jgi:hypothetical protein